MIRGARLLLAAGCLSAALRAAQAAQALDAPDPRDPASRPPTGLRSLLRGPTIQPGPGLVTDRAGRLRTLELDDLTPWRVRVSIPF